jgi:hypothetical protein
MTESNWIEPPLLPYGIEDIGESIPVSINMVQHILYSGHVYTVWFDEKGIINWWENEQLESWRS